MIYRFASVSLVALALCLASCDRKAPEAAKVEPEHVAETTMVETPEAPEAEGPHYKSKEGNAYYYEGGDGQLTGVLDLGEIKQSGDPNGNIKVGDRVLMMDGGVFAALTPGSQIVRVLRRRGMGAAFDQEATLPLDGSSIAAVALRDALAGHISPPPAPQQVPVANAEPIANAEAPSN